MTMTSTPMPAPRKPRKPRKPRAPVTLDPVFKAAALAVLGQHLGQGHIFSGGTGVSCYVWVTGPSTRKGWNIRALLGGFTLDLRNGRVYTALRAVPGCAEVSINVD